MGGEEDDGEPSSSRSPAAQPDSTATSSGEPVNTATILNDDAQNGLMTNGVKRSSPRLVYTSLGRVARQAAKQTGESTLPLGGGSGEGKCKLGEEIGKGTGNERPQDATQKRPRECKPVPKPSPLVGRAASEKVTAEINQLSRRYGKSFQRGKVEQDGSFWISFKMPIQDPDFPFDLEALHLKLKIPKGYPETAHTTFEVLNEDIPAAVRTRIRNRMDEASEKTPKGEPTIKTLLLLLQKSLEKWMVALPTIANAGSSSIRIIPAKDIVVSPAPPATATVSAAISTSSSARERLISSSEVEAVCKSLEYTSVGVPMKKEMSTISRFQLPEHIKVDPVSSNAKAGTIQIELEELVMDGVGLMIPAKVGISFRCARCKHVTPVPDLRDGVDRIVPCGGCKQYMEIAFLREALHPHNHRLGYIRTKRAVPTDLLPITFQATCAECNPPPSDVLASSIKVEGVQVGEKVNFACRNCHAASTLSFEKVSWSEIAAPTVLIDKAGKPLVASKLPTKVGDPLPDFGTCAHYRKSHRWFRFPCCGRAYPCDECHADDSANKGHEAEWASRQICGYCSREFPTSQKYCLCGETPASAAKQTAHWEGGKGTRDQAKMSRKDKKKYRNTDKTVSSKARAAAKT